jgi:ribonuclease-3
MLTDENLDACQKVLKYTFKDAEYLRRALTHASVKTAEQPSNERLEFLGDAVLGMVISEYLFQSYPSSNEGELTQVKSVVVSTITLAAESRRLGIDGFFHVGKGLHGQDTLPTSLMANVFEAIVAAIFLDGGLNPARKFILANLKRQIDRVEKNQHAKNYKSMLQHYAQRKLCFTPFYRVLDESGPEHLKSFLVVTRIGNNEHEMAWGQSKKDAEQKAARATLVRLGIIDKNGNRIHKSRKSKV